METGRDIGRGERKREGVLTSDYCILQNIFIVCVFL